MSIQPSPSSRKHPLTSLSGYPKNFTLRNFRDYSPHQRERRPLSTSLKTLPAPLCPSVLDSYILKMGESLNSHRLSSDLSTLKILPGYSVSHSAGYLIIIIYWHFGQNFNFHILLNITSKNNKQQKQQLKCLEMLLCSPHGFSVLIHISLFNSLNKPLN